MTQAIVIETPFRDAQEFIEGFRSHIADEYLVLPASMAIEQGEWVQFHVALADQTPIFEGFGRCSNVVDNGDEVEESQRYYLMLDSLQLEGVSQDMFDEIMRARSADDDSAVLSDDAMQLDDASDLQLEGSPTSRRQEVEYLSRPPVAGSWRPQDDAQHVSTPPSGLFNYAQGLPLPTKPPHPEPHTYYVVEPAPRPVSEGQAPGALEAPDLGANVSDT